MKKDTDELHQLVSSLTLSERRYCSLYLAKHGSTEDNRYLKLFDCLKKQDEYNAALVMKEMHYEKKPGHYSVLKSQLYEQLLDALHQSALFSDPEQQLLRNIHQCYLLLNKDLFAQCEKRLANLWKTAVAMDFGVAQLELQFLKMTMMGKNSLYRLTEADLNIWEEDAMGILKGLTAEVRYRYLQSRIDKIRIEVGVRSQNVAATMEPIIKLPDFSDEANAPTLRSKIYFCYAMASYYFQNLEPEKALRYNEKILEILENNPVKSLKERIYPRMLYMYLVLCKMSVKDDLFESGLVKLRNLPNMRGFRRFEKPEMDSLIFQMGYSLEMDYLIVTGRFADGYLKVKEVKNGLKKFGGKIAKFHRIPLQHMMAYMCFALAKYDEALDHLHPVIREQEGAVAEHIQLTGRMMQLLCHFEKDDKLLLDSLVKSLQRTLRDMNDSVDILRTVLSFINSSINKTKVEYKQWVELEKKIDNIFENKVPEGVANLFSYKVWVAAHVRKIGFAEAWVYGHNITEV